MIQLRHQVGRVATALRRRVEGPIKEVCCAYLTGLAGLSHHSGPSGPAVMGFVCQELFDDKLGGFGGFGWTVRTIASHYNARADGLTVRVVLPQDLGLVVRPEWRREDRTDVLLLPSLPRLLRHAPTTIRRLEELEPRFLLSMDYLTKYEYALWALPRTPLVVYLRDPRGLHEWRRIATVPLEVHANRRHHPAELADIAVQHRQSFDRVRRWASWLGRPIIFAANAPCLVERARRKFGIADLMPYHLPNPVPLPAGGPVQRAERPTFLFLGRSEPIKRPWIALELARRHPEVDFVMAGATRLPEVMRPMMNRYAGLPNVEWVGHVDGARKAELLRRCWAVLNTSIHEGLPVSFLEAFSYATPVVSSQDPDGLVSRFGYPVRLGEGDGLDDETLQSFCEALGACIDDASVRRERGRAARRHVEEHHTFDCFDRHLKAMLVAEGLIDPPPGRLEPPVRVGTAGPV